jgi:Transcriptional regulatory protein, C terminal
MMSTSPTAVLRFASFELDPRSGELRKKGDLVPLRPQALRVLTVLAARSGEVVTRDEIRQQIWSEDTFVDFDQGLNLARLGDAAGALHCWNGWRPAASRATQRWRTIRGCRHWPRGPRSRKCWKTRADAIRLLSTLSPQPVASAASGWKSDGL